MKKILQIIFLFILFSCSLKSDNDKLILIQWVKWINLYQNSSKDLSIIDVDLNNAWVSFWMVNSSTWNIVIDYEKAGSKKDRFYRFYSKDLQVWTNNKVFAMVNWQFFNADKNPTFLSFPVKSNWKIITSYVDNDIKKRTLIIDKKNNLKIFEGYDKKELYDDNNKDLIVAFNPTVDSSIDEKIWRTYIWIKWEKNIVFFIAKNKTQDEMNKIISEYGIGDNDIVMMDWWPSSQFWYFDNWIKSFYWEWPVPQYNLIYTK
jgi:hypothetical protein